MDMIDEQRDGITMTFRDRRTILLALLDKLVVKLDK
jgi:hypothetical protein